MNIRKDEKWLDDQISGSIDSAKVDFEPEKWKQNYSEEVQILKSRLKQHSRRDRTTSTQIWRIIMKNRITKLAAAAAVIIVAVMLGLNLMSGTQGIALAEVLENVVQIRTFSWRNTVEMLRAPGAPEYTPSVIESEALFSMDHGAIIKSFTIDQNGNREKLVNATYAIMSERILINIVPEKKQYLRFNITDERWEELEKELSNPGTILEEFLKKPYIELGQDVVDGIDAIGFESTKADVTTMDFASSVARIWIDTGSHLPVKIEIESFDENGQLVTKASTFDYKWDIPVGPEDFVPDIPQDYENLGEVEFDLSEISALRGFAFFAELTGGRYPSDLSRMILRKEFNEALIAKHNGQPPEPDNKTIQKFIDLNSISDFYNELIAKNRSPAYFGKIVTSEFPDAVLMRWREDDGQYKVVFGDLTVKNVNADELAQLERGHGR